MCDSGLDCVASHASCCCPTSSAHLTARDGASAAAGAGSKSDRGFIGVKDSRYQYPWSGFVSVKIDANLMVVKFYNLEGGTTPAYTATIPRQLAG